MPRPRRTRATIATAVSNGVAGLRREVAIKYKHKYGVELDPETEVIATIGSKEGFSHLCLALLGPGDTAIVPDPAFPIHIYAVAMAGANVIRVPLGNDQAFLDRIEMMIEGLYPTPKLLILNYPHNPTAMTIDAGVLGAGNRHVPAARHHDHQRLRLWRSLLRWLQGPQLSGRPRRQGNRRRIHDHDQELQHGRLARRLLLGQCRNGQGTGDDQRATTTTAFSHRCRSPASSPCASAPTTPEDQAAIYQERRDEVCRGLDKLGWTYEKPRASMFVWAKIKPEHLKGQGTIDFCLRMMDEAEVSLSPGRAFGEGGEDYVRIALVENEHRLRQAMRNLDRVLNPRQPKPKRQAAEQV